MILWFLRCRVSLGRETGQLQLLVNLWNRDPAAVAGILLPSAVENVAHLTWETNLKQNGAFALRTENRRLKNRQLPNHRSSGVLSICFCRHMQYVIGYSTWKVIHDTWNSGKDRSAELSIKTGTSSRLLLKSMCYIYISQANGSS